LDEDAVAFARGQFVPHGSPQVGAYGSRRLEDKNSLPKLASDLHLERAQCAALLAPGDYQILLVEAPNVPKPELKSAIRWRLKDMLDYHVDDATIEVLDIPPDAAGTSRGHMMYAVCAKNQTVERCIKAFHGARIPISVIDIRETAQRNLAALFEEPGRGLAVVHFQDDSGLLTITFNSELYLARRLEPGNTQFASANEATRKDAFERVALELQRTFDHFDRQFSYVPIARLLVGPMPQENGLIAYLAQNLTVPVQAMDLGSKLAFDSGVPDAPTLARFFHHFGASLRREAKAL
jgi:MSHA biogenesis protein MshI